LRKPQAGELRGIKLLDVMQMDVTAYMQLLPRITAPMLTEQQVSALDPADLMKVMNGVQHFFLDADSQTM
ncbi:phage tail assembly protein, partial [Alteromonas sp. a30]|uniref:phage tail assembly protein n=1 Tax=Alteromonas sp. a30 TaxID=2730917 RepID=UPI00228046FA